jgi:DNA-binding beta-propeller fold protein YncE
VPIGLAVSPDGTEVFVTGRSVAVGEHRGDLATVAYAASTGAQVWAVRYHAFSDIDDTPRSVSVGPDGATVFVTGTSETPFGPEGLTIAYDASSGARRWVKRSHVLSVGNSVAVGPSGTTVFVAGQAGLALGTEDYCTIAYDASTGARRWSKRYNGSASGTDAALDAAVSPDGTRLFVTGGSEGLASGSDYLTIAYDTSAGARLWSARYRGPASDDTALALAVSPAGTRLFVTGRSEGLASGMDDLTISYDTSTGSRRWTSRYNSGSDHDDAADAIAVSADGTRVFVTGWRWAGATGYDYQTLALAAANGSRTWLQRYNDPINNRADQASSVAVGPDGMKVFVSGHSGGGIATFAYAA